MGQIFGNINDPKARDSGRGSLPATPDTPPSTAIHSYSEAQASTLEVGAGALAPGVVGIGEVLRTRRDEFAKRLEAADYLLDLSQRRAADLTLDEITEIWESL